MAKRKIITELIEGVEAMKKQREGKLTLRSYRVEAAALVLLVRMYPDTLERLEKVAMG